MCACSHSLGEVEISESLGQSVTLTCWPISQPSELGKFLASERPCLKKKKIVEQHLSQDTRGHPRPLHTCAPVSTEIQSVTYVCTYNLMAYTVIL